MTVISRSDRVRFRSAVAALLIGASLPSTTLAAGPELNVIDAPAEAPAASSFYVRVRIGNGGSEPLRVCDTAEGAPLPDRPCFAIAYRRDKRPPRLVFWRVEVAPVLARSVGVPPGEVMERLVRIPTASSGSEQSVYLYLVTGTTGRLDWKEVPLRVKLGPPPPEVRRTVLVAWSLLVLYVAVTAWLVGRVMRRRDSSRT